MPSSGHDVQVILFLTGETELSCLISCFLPFSCEFCVTGELMYSACPRDAHCVTGPLWREDRGIVQSNNPLALSGIAQFSICLHKTKNLKYQEKQKMKNIFIPDNPFKDIKPKK